jgi:apolipoprotein N-acyltransferase
LSAEAEAPILFGASAAEIQSVVRLPGGRFMTAGPRWNTAFLMTPDSKPYAVAHEYSKVHLVPFGETVPFKDSWPWLREQLMALSPYDFDYTVEPGERGQTPFEIAYRAPGGDGALADKPPVAPGAEAPRTARFQVAICYEDAMAYRIREMVRPGPPGRRKDIDFLVNISNDGWFNGSIELDQHLNLCVFRAVENRIPIVRSVNTGISAIIRSDGRIEKVVADAAGNRRYIEGETHGRLALDDRRAPYTGAGDVLAIGCLAWTAAVPVWLAGARLRRARGKAAPQAKAGGA